MHEANCQFCGYIHPQGPCMSDAELNLMATSKPRTRSGSRSSDRLCAPEEGETTPREVKPEPIRIDKLSNSDLQKEVEDLEEAQVRHDMEEKCRALRERRQGWAFRSDDTARPQHTYTVSPTSRRHDTLQMRDSMRHRESPQRLGSPTRGPTRSPERHSLKRDTTPPWKQQPGYSAFGVWRPQR